jgi:hypothetical protein
MCSSSDRHDAPSTCQPCGGCYRARVATRLLQVAEPASGSRGSSTTRTHACARPCRAGRDGHPSGDPRPAGERGEAARLRPGRRDVQPPRYGDLWPLSLRRPGLRFSRCRNSPMPTQWGGTGGTPEPNWLSPRRNANPTQLTVSKTLRSVAGAASIWRHAWGAHERAGFGGFPHRRRANSYSAAALHGHQRAGRARPSGSASGSSKRSEHTPTSYSATSAGPSASDRHQPRPSPRRSAWWGGQPLPTLPGSAYSLSVCVPRLLGHACGPAEVDLT